MNIMRILDQTSEESEINHCRKLENYVKIITVTIT